jgi:hypothetical protein
MASYIVQEEDGTSKLTLEEGDGSLLLEESTPDVEKVKIPFVVQAGGMRW